MQQNKKTQILKTLYMTNSYSHSIVAQNTTSETHSMTAFALLNFFGK